MSDQLPNVNLSTAQVGATGTIDFPVSGILDPSQDSHIRLFNESGCGLSIQFSDGTSDFIPAGAWPIYAVASNVAFVNWTVVYVLPSANVTLLVPIYYYPGESIPTSVVLGNSPVAGATSTSGSTLSNEGGTSTTLVIDIGDNLLAQLLTIYAGGQSTWEVDQSGTRHQVIKINASGNPLQLGQAGDISEVLGQLTVDQLLQAIGALTVGTTLGVTGNTTVTTLEASGMITGNAGITVPSGQKYYQANQPVPRTSWGTTGALSANSSNTISHGLGAVPALVLLTNYVSNGATSTFATFNYTSTTFELYTYDASTYKWLALIF